MKRYWMAAGCLLGAGTAVAQQTGSYAAWRQQYQDEFLTDARSPLRAADTGFLRFFPYDGRFARPTRIHKQLKRVVVTMATHSGKTKQFLDYGWIGFLPGEKAHWDSGTLNLTKTEWGRARRRFRLHLYQSLDSTGTVRRPDEFFLPFTDATNGVTTYGGGRYIDLHVSPAALKSGWITVDFNRAYNPWCAYKEGYNCPIPPKENRVPIAVAAGEKTFGRHPEE